MFTISPSVNGKVVALSNNTIAFIPEKEEDVKTGLGEIITEKNITPQFRQQEFENFNTTDDHLMHITGKVKDQKGNVYYKIKNSWGTGNYPGGYLYVSENYFNLKTINIYLHKEGVPSDLRKKLKV